MKDQTIAECGHGSLTYQNRKLSVMRGKSNIFKKGKEHKLGVRLLTDTRGLMNKYLQQLNNRTEIHGPTLLQNNH